MAGGVLAFGIPEYRLPKNVLQHEIDLITMAGVNLWLNIDITKDFTFQSLRSKYDAVYVATGALSPEKINIPGEDLPGVIHGIEFLKRVNLSKGFALGGPVSVMAAELGNRLSPTALRLEQRRKGPLQAYKRLHGRPIRGDQRRDRRRISITSCIARELIAGADGGGCKIECVRMEAGLFCANGRRRTVPVEGSNSSWRRASSSRPSASLPTCVL